MNRPHVAPDAPGTFVLPREILATVCRIGDAMLWAWGEATRNGHIQALLEASAGDLAALLDTTIAATTGSPRAPGTHSNPTLARLIAAELESENEKRKLVTALHVECEIAFWREVEETQMWVLIAGAFYAAPYTRSNGEVGRELQISKSQVEHARTSMRRALALPVVLTRAAA